MTILNFFHFRSDFRFTEKMLNVLETDPVLDLSEDSSDHNFSQIHTKKRPKQSEILTLRAALGDNEFDENTELFETLKTKANSKKENDLRSLITKMKLSHSYDTDTRSDDSFYSAENFDPKVFSLSYIRDMINCLGSENLTLKKKMEVMKTLSKIELSVKIAEPLTCSGKCDFKIQIPQNLNFFDIFRL